MFKNYLKIAFRNLYKQKVFSAINILGLSLGVTCFVLILLFIQDELSYDRYHLNADRIYRMTEKVGDSENSSSQPFSAPPTLAEEYPGMVEHAVRFFNMQAPTLTIESDAEHRYNEPRFFFVDSTVFEVFSFPFIKGDPETALLEPYSIAITEPMARKYFGNQEPIGKTLRFEGEHDLKVTAVLAPTPKNSHFQFDFLASFSTVTGIQNGQKPEGWYWNPCWSYLLLTEGTAPEALAEYFPEFVDKHFPDFIKAEISLHLQPLTDIHLHSHLDYEIEANSNVAYVYIFSIIAAFILFIACINYMNLATARSAKRAREVGMRKVLGAVRPQLISQFLGESFLMSLLAVTLALPMVDFSLPVLNSFLNKSLELDLFNNSLLLWSLLGTVGLVGFVAGIYPAFILSAFRPVHVFKGELKTGGFDWTVSLRKGLVVTQFTISIFLIIGTLVAKKQLQFLQQQGLGFNQEQVVMVNILRANLAAQYDEIKNQLLQNNNIKLVTTAEDVLGSKCQTSSLKPEGHTEAKQFQRLMVGYDFVETLDLELAAGRSFDKAHATDDSLAIVINEAMVKHLGWGSPQEALGKNFGGGRHNQKVVGVLKDFHYASLHNPIGPFVFLMPSNEGQHNFFDRYMALRIAPENYKETIAHIEKVWSGFLPDRPFEYFFMDEKLDHLYRAEENLGKVAGIFSAFALFVACIGLLGIVSFMAETRTKEIGIRKVLGATTVGIVGLLSKDFLKLVFIALFIASPLAYFTMDKWLQDFAYRTEVSWWVYAAAGAIALAVAFFTVGFQSIKAALANPVKSLRSE